jgi:hypothetical protein
LKQFVLFIFCLISFSGTSQIFVEAEIHFLDHTKKQGLAYINGVSDKIIFKEDKKSKKVKYNHRDVDKLFLKKDTIIKEFRYKKAPDRRAPRLLQLVIDHHKVSLYATFTEYRPGGLIGAIFDIKQTDYIYYLVKDQKNKAIYVGEKGITSKKRMAKVIKKNFGDCSYLVKKADEKEFKLKDIIKIVEHYNNNCSKETN